MSRQQLPPQIKKVDVLDRKTGKMVVRYQLTVDSGLDPASGKRRQVRRRYATEKMARDALSEVTSAAITGTFVPRKAVTVEQLSADWLASLHNARATTVNAYVYALAPLRERHGGLPVQKLSRPDLDRLLIDLRDGGTTTAKGHTRRRWSARSLNKAVDAWRSMLAYGVERRELAHNVAAAMRKVPRARSEMQSYTPDEIGQVLRAADRDRNGHLWYLALSGLRRGEIAGLRWSDIDLDGRTLSVERNRVQAGAGNVVEGDPKTLSSRRTLPLDDGLAAVLRRASARYAQERLALGADHHDSGYVAVNAAGEPYTPDTLTRMWLKMAKTAKVRPIRLHDARHSCGTAMHLRGVPVAVIAKWLGHADPSITVSLYVHSQDDALKAASATLGEVLTAGH
ncbi:tyrosine-type recombinase/integrase [Mycolicibacterium fluoranthenivorans]|uniref:Site-specific recombinase XerD n=1 Tax=Mycolicibacterium fluoranthenivorans TaxID=258505 RepID=A0A1G4WZG3_9MYCO|nr:tyrosine-type recombinase/integrase [Mycolicibacterium fluoranthenivorans]SCX32909.1 Site-specific recombinase XerD [Mycolicibacterium fluoranthenivorans]